MARLSACVAAALPAAALLFSIFLFSVSAYCQTPPASPLPSLPSADVAYRNGPERAGYQDTTLPMPLSLLWRHTTQGVRGNSAGPAAASGTAYFAGGSAVYAVSAKSGATLWQTPTTATVETTPALSGGSLYIGADDGTVLKLDAASGRKLWSVKVGGAVRSSPLVQDGAVYLGCADSHLYALNADTGAPLWNVPVGGPVTTSPIAYGNQIAFAAADNTLNSVSRTGRLLWTQHLSDDPTPSPPLYANGTVYAAAGTTVYALSGRSGTVRWARNLPADVVAPLTLGPNGLFAVTQEKGVYALSPERGRFIWKATLAFPGGAPPLLTNNILLVPTQHGILHALDTATGTLKWQYVLPSSGTLDQPRYATTDANSAPVYADGTLYVQTDDGTLSAFRADAPDAVPPQAFALSPAPGAVTAGVNVPYGAGLSDIGSGIDPASVTLTVDKIAVLRLRFDPAQSKVITDAPATGTDTARPLKDGPHQMVLTAQDWRGNALTRTWGFVVDSRLNPQVTPTPVSGDAPQPEVPVDNGPQAAPTPMPTAPGGGGGSNPGQPPAPPPF